MRCDVTDGEHDTAYGHRDTRYIPNINTRPGADLNVNHTRQVWEPMLPHPHGGGYTNFLGDEGSDRVRTVHGDEEFRRLHRTRAHP